MRSAHICYRNTPLLSFVNFRTAESPIRGLVQAGFGAARRPLALYPCGVEGYSVHQPVILAEIKDTPVEGGEIVPQGHRAGFPVESALELRAGLVAEKEVQHSPALALIHADNFPRHQFGDKQKASLAFGMGADNGVF